MAYSGSIYKFWAMDMSRGTRKREGNQDYLPFTRLPYKGVIEFKLDSWYCIFGTSMSDFIIPVVFSLLYCLKVSFLKVNQDEYKFPLCSIFPVVFFFFFFFLAKKKLLLL